MIAVTNDGLKVKLHEDGTWEKYTEEAKVMNNGSFDVRNLNWGMNQENVLNAENIDLKLNDTGDMFFGESRLAGLDTLIAFDFIHNELYSVRYIFTNEHSDEGHFVNDLENLKNNLIKKYGEPKEDNRYFTDDLYEDIPSEWGMSLGRGKLSYFIKWQINDTEILLALFGDNHQIKFNLNYSSIKYQSIVDENNKQSLLDEL